MYPKYPFSPERKDDPALWQSWLFYPGTEHRIALSIKDMNIESETVEPRERNTLRFFESVPLMSCQEMSSQELCNGDFTN